MMLEDYNREDIEEIDELKKELSNLYDEYEDLRNRVAAVFTKFKQMEFKDKRVQNPCVKCIVRASCEIKERIKNGAVLANLPFTFVSENTCDPKLKSCLISEIKRNRHREKHFVDEKTEEFLMKNHKSGWALVYHFHGM